MANIILSLADTAGFIPQSWANQALKVLRNNITLTQAIARDSDFTDAGWKGKTLNIPYPGTFTAQAKVANNVAVVQTPTGGSSVNVTLGQPQTVDFIVEDVAFSQAQSGVNMMENFGSAAGIAIAEKLESDLMATIITGLTGQPNGTAQQPGAVGAALNYAAVVAARKVLVDNKAPNSDRALILNTKDYAAALQDSSLLGYFQFQNPQAFTDAQPGNIAGFNVKESQLTPVIDGAATPGAIQSLTPSGTWSSGAFTLTYGAQTTANLPFNATAKQVETALNALSSIGAGKVRVSGGPFGGASGPAMQVVFVGIASPTAITFTIGTLAGSTPGLTIANNATQANLSLAIHKNAMVLAIRPMQTMTKPGVEVAYANDPVSGISIRVQMQVKPEYRGLYVAYDILYGMAIIRPNQGVVVLG